MQKIPKELLKSNYRKIMWKHAREIINEVKQVMPVSKAYVIGSFDTKKKRPGDIDFVIMLKTPTRNKEKWAVDLVIMPDNAFGDKVKQDTFKWMKQKYGSKKHEIIELF